MRQLNATLASAQPFMNREILSPSPHRRGAHGSRTGITLPRCGSVQGPTVSGGIITMIFIADGADANNTFVMRTDSWDVYVPLDNTSLAYSCAVTEKGRDEAAKPKAIVNIVD